MATNQSRHHESLYSDDDNSDLWTRRVSDKKLLDFLRNNIASTSFDDLHVANRRVKLEMKFYYDVEIDAYVIDEQNGGSVSRNNLIAELSTGTSSNGSCYVETRESTDYRVSQDFVVSGSARFDVSGDQGSQSGYAGSEQYFGLFNGSNGFYIGYNGDSKLGVFRKRQGVVEESIYQDDFDDPLDGTGCNNFSLDASKFNIFRFEFSWHGVGYLKCYILGEDCEWLNFLTVNYVNRLEESSIGIPHLPLKASVSKDSGSRDVKMYLQAASVSVVGEESSAGTRSFSVDAEGETSSGTLVPLLSIRNKTTYQSVANKIKFSLSYISVSADGNRTVRFRIIRNGTLTDESYSDIDADNSIVEYDTSASAISGGKLELPIQVARTGQSSLLSGEIILDINPGEIITVAALSSASNIVVDCGLRWKEFH